MAQRGAVAYDSQMKRKEMRLENGKKGGGDVHV